MTTYLMENRVTLQFQPPLLKPRGAEKPLLHPLPLPSCSTQMPWGRLLNVRGENPPVSPRAEADDALLLLGCKRATIFPN